MEEPFGFVAVLDQCRFGEAMHVTHPAHVILVNVAYKPFGRVSRLPLRWPAWLNQSHQLTDRRCISGSPLPTVSICQAARWCLPELLLNKPLNVRNACLFRRDVAFT